MNTSVFLLNKIDFDLMRPKSETNCIESANTLKPGLHISCKDHKHVVGNVYFKMYGYGLLSLSLESLE